MMLLLPPSLLMYIINPCLSCYVNCWEYKKPHFLLKTFRPRVSVYVHSLCATMSSTKMMQVKALCIQTLITFSQDFSFILYFVFFDSFGSWYSQIYNAAKNNVLVKVSINGILLLVCLLVNYCRNRAIFTGDFSQ